MSFRCPGCNRPLTISLSLDTNVDKAKENLHTLTSQPSISLTNEELSNLKWRQSAKLMTLSTILITDENRNLPLLNDLYRAVKQTPLKIGDVTYKLSVTETACFLQRWQIATGGGAGQTEHS